MRTLLLIILALTASLSYAQKTYEIKSIITGSSGQALTNPAGAFSFKLSTDSFVIVATHSGLESYTSFCKISNNNVVFHITPFIMAPAIG